RGQADQGRPAQAAVADRGGQGEGHGQIKGRPPGSDTVAEGRRPSGAAPVHQLPLIDKHPEVNPTTHPSPVAPAAALPAPPAPLVAPAAQQVVAEVRRRFWSRSANWNLPNSLTVLRLLLIPA